MLQYVEWLQEGSHFVDKDLKVALYNQHSQLICASASLSEVLSKLHLLQDQLTQKQKQKPKAPAPGGRSTSASAPNEPSRDSSSVISEEQLERSIELAKAVHLDAKQLQNSLLSATEEKK
jgi:hypothetical protein